MKVSTVAEMRQLDQRVVEEFGITNETLMEKAGEAVCLVIEKELGVQDRKFIVFCGSGNNGGDGFVVARRLHSSGGDIRVFLLGERGRYQGIAKRNLEELSRLPVDIKEIESVEEARAEVLAADAIVDAMLGTGLEREVGGLYHDAIVLVNESGKKVFAVDIASGVSGDTGREMGVSVKADYTITLGLPKLGNMLYPGYGRCGRLYVSHISFPSSLYGSETIKVEISELSPLPDRQADTNKMDYGPVLVIAGAANYFWAPHASAYSCLKAGGGYVFLACPASMVSHIASGGREVVFQPQEETASGSIALKNKDALLELSERVRMVVIGPGLSLNEETQALVRELAKEIDKPLLIDGDGITAISQDVEIIKGRKAPTILTPHAGEMARIAKLESSEIERDKVGPLQRMARELNATVVLKGPHTLIGYPDERVCINVSGATGGRAGMATAGTGDVLNGTIAGMFCLGLDIGEAVKTGVFVHGLAGDLTAEEIGPDGMTAQDILNALPEAVRYYREDLPMLSENHYGAIHLV
jgi:NAD(P)H-hydrate epimerase